ncbi:aromatic ring-hydroxylating dioxygenase subunit alpha [Burkholderia sp. Ac-20353]|uniref:aromatic ring-hydroxylating oxygenase subunit alpha n=1 Tax=Burkholderia sp. Ac-20353 TaxID=2703894 RepID=UPI00197BCF03|nr:aromatic ring-hydroxylating dioxygenase subunit alpha [Burkholderia sp. Ac-20353]MBN3786539.1 aromatic ring-hydroxylating dioxygenase subunit alpha [Burkholderia sp. Ac-20353]
MRPQILLDRDLPRTDDSRIAELFAQRAAGHTLPQALYMSDAAFDFDMRAIFERSWLQIGFEAEICDVGSYITVEIGKSSVVIIRDRDMNVRAFMNTCRHRGARICPEGSGAARRLVCPYHQWTYDLSGTLIHARNMGPDFDQSIHGLIPVQCETVAGLIFIALSEDVPPFGPFRTALEPLLAPHNLKDAKVAHAMVIVEDANWKLVMENGRECYHCNARHPELLTAFRDPSKENYFGQTPPWMTEFQSMCTGLGFKVGPEEGEWYDMQRFPLAEGAVSLTTDGKLGCRKMLMEAPAQGLGSFRWATEPQSFSHALADYAFSFEAWPVSPTRTNVKAKWLVHKDAVEGVDYEIEHLTALWRATNDQDKWLSENNHLGVASAGYRPGPYSKSDEGKVLDFVDWYCRRAESYINRKI